MDGINQLCEDFEEFAASLTAVLGMPARLGLGCPAFLSLGVEERISGPSVTPY